MYVQYSMFVVLRECLVKKSRYRVREAYSSYTSTTVIFNDTETPTHHPEAKSQLP